MRHIVAYHLHNSERRQRKASYYLSEGKHMKKSEQDQGRSLGEHLKTDVQMMRQSFGCRSAERTLKVPSKYFTETLFSHGLCF